MTHITKPTQSLLNGFVYTPSAATDVTQTWRKFGWVPIQEQPVLLERQQDAKGVLNGR